jgi:hypothetical protein
VAGSPYLSGALRGTYEYPQILKPYQEQHKLIHSSQMFNCVTDAKSKSFLEVKFWRAGKNSSS